MPFRPKHLSADEIRELYRRPLARLEQVLLAEHMSVVIEPEYEPSAEDKVNAARAELQIERLEADLAQQLDGRE